LGCEEQPVGLRQADTPAGVIVEEPGVDAARRESRVAAPRENAAILESSEGPKSGARSSAGSVSAKANIINRCNQYGTFGRHRRTAMATFRIRPEEERPESTEQAVAQCQVWRSQVSTAQDDQLLLLDEILRDHRSHATGAHSFAIITAK
jgi:hypothetical protein